MTPLTKSVVMPMLENATAEAMKALWINTAENVQFFADINGRLYVNSELLRHNLADFIPPYSDLGPEVFPAPETAHQVDTRGFLSRAVLFIRSALHFRLLIGRVYKVLEKIDSTRENIAKVDFKGKNDAALYLLIEEAINDGAAPAMTALIDAGLCRVLAHAALRQTIDRPGDEDARMLHAELLQGATDADRVTDAWKLARLASSIGGIPVKLRDLDKWSAIKSDLTRIEGGELFLKRLEVYLDHYGHRCFGEMEFSQARWAENPIEISRTLAALIDAGEEIDPLARKEVAQAKSREAMRDIERRLNPLSRLVFRATYRQATEADIIKRRLRDSLAAAMNDLRTLALDAARRFKDRKELAEENDIFLLALDEIKHVLALDQLDMDIADIVRERREEFDHLSAMKHVASEIPESEDIQVLNIYDAESEIDG